MTCTEFTQNFADENSKNISEIIDEAIDCFKKEDAKRDRELYEFIDDFVQSQEYLDYIRERSNILKKTAATQCDPHDIIVEITKNSDVERYPLTRERKKMYAFKEHFERYMEREAIEEGIKKQKRGIQIIKAKINEARRIFQNTMETKRRQKEERKEFLLEKYSTEFGIDSRVLRGPALEKLLDRLEKYHNTIETNAIKKKENICSILDKLVKENKMKKEVKKVAAKVTRKEKVIEGLEIVGTKIELIDPNKLKPEQSEVVEEPTGKITEEEMTVKKTGQKEKKDKSKKELKVKAKKTTKEKKMKTKKEVPSNKLEIPVIPILNQREKVLPENIDNIVDLIEEFRDFDNEMENRDILRPQHKYIMGDKGMKFNPEIVLFQDFDAGKSYYKSLTISNVSSQIRKVRFETFIFPDEYDHIVFDVENFGIRKLFTGAKVKLSVNFQPYDAFKAYDGKISFLSYDVHSCNYYRQEVEIRCVPRYSDLKIYPEEVQFGCIPIWKAENCDQFKIIKLQNRGSKPCTLHIMKLFDPLDIEYLFDEENKENVAPTVPENSPTSCQVVRDILEDYLKNLENNFQFDLGFLVLDKSEEVRIKIFFKNASYVGDYFEKFIVNVYETDENNDLQSAGCKTISLYAETTGHFLTTDPELLNFGTCLINSYYQITFDVCNNSTQNQAVSLRVPSSLTDIVQCDVAMVYLSPKSRRTILLKFNPRDIILQDCKAYFDKNTSILEFPIHLVAVSKTSLDYPPVKLPVYAYVTNFEDLTISCDVTDRLSNFLSTLMVDMGDCTICETIWAEISLTNNTAITQFCAFIDLPHAVVMAPNFGFCKLYPGQRKLFKMYLSPEIKDFPSQIIGSFRNNNYFFKLKVETIVSMGQIVPEINIKRLKSSLDIMLKQLTMAENDIYASMLGFIAQIREHLAMASKTDSLINKATNIISGPCSVILDKNYSRQTSYYNSPTEIDTLLNFQNFLIVETNSRREMWFKVNLRRPLVEFSHQTVEFPDTPCGSYSVMEVKLAAPHTKKTDKPDKKKNNLNYKAHFEIVGGSDEVRVEPTCGILSMGESIQITFMVQPNVPSEIVQKTARSIKYSQIYEMKLREYQAKGSEKREKMKKSNKKGDSNDKKTSKKSKATTKKKEDNKDKEKSQQSQTSSEPNIVITDKELECDFLELFPAEMVYWRTLEPYYIRTNFTCLLDYESKSQKMLKQRVKLYLEAICKVIRPDFTLNLNTQRIDFGTCLIGMKSSRIIVLQNITYDNIKPSLSLLNPMGCFSIPTIANLLLPPEHFLKLPVTFTPKSTEQALEYIEIKSNATVMPLILCGTGAVPNIVVIPEFEIYRLETKRNKIAELHFKIENFSEAEATINFEKIFEIEANLVDLPSTKTELKEVHTVKGDVQKGKEKKAKKNKAKENKETKSYQNEIKEKSKTNSDSFTDNELKAIESCFNKTRGSSHFDVNSSSLRLNPKSHGTIVFFCGEPDLIKKKKEEGPKKDKKVKRKAKEKEEIKSDISGDISPLDEVKKITIIQDKQFISQYNLNLGTTHLKSITIICTIKCSQLN